MWNRGLVTTAAALLAFLATSVSHAADQEGCLFCHRLEIASYGSGVPDLRVADRAGNRHEALYCSDCHPDAKLAPHAVIPGPARCIEACHAAAPGGVPESHRRAAFGGLTESHRKIALPAGPCLACHRADDPPATASPAAARCAGCHPGEGAALSEGVHARLSASGGGSGCPACHLPHPPSAGQRAEAGVSCKRPGCHDSVTDRMRRLGAHGKGRPEDRPGRVPSLLLFAAISAFGIVPGAWLAGSARDRKGGGK